MRKVRRFNWAELIIAVATLVVVVVCIVLHQRAKNSELKPPSLPKYAGRRRPNRGVSSSETAAPGTLKTLRSVQANFQQAADEDDNAVRDRR